MKLDLHTHFYTDAFFQTIRDLPSEFSFGTSSTGQTIITYRGARFFGVTPAMTDVSKRIEDMDRVGIDVEVVDLRSIVPLDMETVYASVQKTGRLLAVHESQSNCGIGAEVVARIYEEAPHLLSAPARRLGMAPASIPVSQKLEEELLPWKKNIKAAVLDMMLRPVAA